MCVVGVCTQEHSSYRVCALHRVMGICVFSSRRSFAYARTNLARIPRHIETTRDMRRDAVVVVDARDEDNDDDDANDDDDDGDDDCVSVPPTSHSCLCAVECPKTIR